MITPHEAVHPYLVAGSARRGLSELERYAASEGLSVADLMPRAERRRPLRAVLAPFGRRRGRRPADVRRPRHA